MYRKGVHHHPRDTSRGLCLCVYNCVNTRLHSYYGVLGVLFLYGYTPYGAQYHIQHTYTFPGTFSIVILQTNKKQNARTYNLHRPKREGNLTVLDILRLIYEHVGQGYNRQIITLGEVLLQKKRCSLI